MRKSRLELFMFVLSVMLLFGIVLHFSPLCATYALENSTSLPSVYSLFELPNVYGVNREVQTASLPKNVGNQRQTSICWTFATNTALETSIYLKAKNEDNFDVEGTLNFSELDMVHTLFKKRDFNRTGAGTFDLALEYLTSEYGPVIEQDWESNSIYWDNDEEVFNYYDESPFEKEYSKYSIMEAYSFTSRSQIESRLDWDTLRKEGQIQSLRQSIKEHILNYGGCTATIYSNNVFYDNKVPTCTYLYLGNNDQNHMITLVGWDDEYTYTRGGYTYTGAYIAQNSYGTNFGEGGFFYIMYDDSNIENNVCGFKDISYTLSTTHSDVTKYNHTLGLTNENEFSTYELNGSQEVFSQSYISISSTTYLANIYHLDNPISNKIFRLKLPVLSLNNLSDTLTQFKVYLIDNIDSSIEDMSRISSNLNTLLSSKVSVIDKDGNDTFSPQFTGYYTIDLGNNAIAISGEYFAVLLRIDSGSLLYVNNSESDSVSLNNTFIKKGNSWTDYNSNSVKCLLPMEIQTSSDLVDITYTLTNELTLTYNGQNIVIPSPSISVLGCMVEYSIDGTWSTTPPSIKDAGEYEVSVRISKNGYNTALDTIQVHVNPATLTITPFDNQSKAYNTSENTISYSYRGKQYNDVISFTGNLDREMGEDVGSYRITLGDLRLNSNLANNYNLVLVEKYFTITPQLLTIKIKDHTSFYGELDKNYEYEVTQGILKAGDDLGLVYSCLDTDEEEVDNTTPVNPDGYTITARSFNSNYQVTIYSGKLYIEYKLYTVLFTVLDTVYTFYYHQFDRIDEIDSTIDTTKSGYIFDYWSLEGERIDVVDFIVMHDTNFVAVFNLVDLSINYVLNGGRFSGYYISTFTVESNLTLFEPERAGYNFAGFFLFPDFSGNSIEDITPQEFWQDITLYCKWEAKEYTVTPPSASLDNSYIVSLPKNLATYGQPFNIVLTLNYAYDKSNPYVYAVYSSSGHRVQARQVESQTSSNLYLNPRANKTLHFVLDSIEDSSFSIEVENVTINTYTVTFFKFNNMMYYHDEDISIHKISSDRELLYISSPITHGSSLSDIPTIATIPHYDNILPIWDNTDFSYIEEDLDVYAIYKPNIYIINFIGEDDLLYQVEFKYKDILDVKKFEEMLNLPFASIVRYNEQDLSSISIVEDNATVHYIIVDYSWIIIAVIIAIISSLILYLFISIFHYISFVKRYK